MASVGDRIYTLADQVTGAAVAIYRITKATLSNGYLEGAMLVQQVDADGNTLGGTGASASQVQGNVAHDAVDSGNPVKVGGKARSSAPSDVANGDRVDAYFDLKGRPVVKVDDGPKSATANVPSIVTSTGDAIAANAARKSWSVQNVGTNPLFVRMGTGASASVFHFIVKGGTADSDGGGGLLSDEVYIGVVSVFGTSPKFVVSEL